MSDTLYAAYNSDDNYAPYLGASMLSLLQSNTSFSRICIYIMDCGMTEESRCNLQHIAARFGREIFFVLMQQHIAQLDLHLGAHKMAVAAYARLFLTQVLPEDCSRVLYIDCDTIVKGSLAEIWKLPFGNALIAGVQDTVDNYFLSAIGLEKGVPYIDAGILIVNLEAWRKENLLAQFLGVIRRFDGNVPAHDQGTINAVCGARVYEILFVVLFVLLAGMLLIAAGDLEMEYLYGFFQADTGSVMKGSLAVFFCLMPLFLLAFFPSYVQKAKWGKLVHAVHAAMWFAIGVLAVLYVILLGSFGSRSLTTMKYPAITLMSSIHLRGSFLKRLDAFMIAIWFFTLFALVTVFLFYAQELVQKLRKKDTHKKWYLCGVMAAVFGVAEMLHQSSHGEWFRDYLLYIGIPLFLFLPLFVLLWGKGKKRHEG